MKVGGKSENAPKKTVFPAALAPSTVTLKTFVVPADCVGWKLKVNFSQEAEMPVRVAVAYTCPEVETNDRVIGPVKLDDLAYREPV